MLRTRPGLNEVRILVEACGVCHTDSMLVNAEIPNLTRVLGTRSSGASMPSARMLRLASLVSGSVLASVVGGTTPVAHASEETLSTAPTLC
jgi:hypothetical protein